MAGKNATLPVTGKAGDWLRIDLGGRSAWVQSNLVTFDATETALSGLTRRTMFQPPSVSITADASITTSGRISLKGAASDDSGVKDYYIFVYNRDDSKLNAKKLEYVRANNGESIDIATNVPLFKGMNRIAIIARDDEGMTTTQSTYVYRK